MSEAPVTPTSSSIDQSLEAVRLAAVGPDVRGGCYQESMSEAPVGSNSRDFSLDQLLEALRPVAFIFEWPVKRERDEQLCDEIARLVDTVIVCLAQCRGALQVAIGE